MDKRLTVRILLVVWISLWVLFLVRPYTKKNLLKEYSVLMTMPLNDKRAFVTGTELYHFLQLSGQAIEPASSYRIIGLEDDPLSYRRAVYYLYPDIDRDQSPEFLLVYKKKNFSQTGYCTFRSFSDDKYILRRSAA